MADEECSIRQKLITAAINVVLAAMRSRALQPAMRPFQPHIMKKPGGLLKEENRKSIRPCSIQVPAFGIKCLTIRQMNPATFVADKASVVIGGEGRMPFHQRSPVNVANERPVAFQSREHIGGSAPVCDWRFQFRVHGPTGLRARDGTVAIPALAHWTR
jgi:hypothetical protein